MTASSDIASLAERRALPRTLTTLRGKVLEGLLECTISDFNDRGARLTLPEGAQVGDSLILIVWSTGMGFQAQVRWRARNEVGVRFVSRCDFRARTPPHFAEAKTVWLESRPRHGRRELRKAKVMLPTPRRYARLSRFL